MILGLGLFETILAIDGVPIFAERHLARLQANCQRLGWHLDQPDLTAIMQQLIDRNELTTGRARIRLAISSGSGPVNDLALGANYLLWMTAVPAAVAPLTTTANLSPWAKNERSPLAGLKCASYAENIVALAHATRLGFEETIFLNTTGQLCETATANLFLVKNGGILTPHLNSGCLPGITRAVVIELARQLAIPCQECDLTPADLHAADEIFLTSSIRSLMGISQFEQRNLPPGVITGTLRDAWTLAIHQPGDG